MPSAVSYSCGLDDFSLVKVKNVSGLMLKLHVVGNGHRVLTFWSMMFKP